MAFENVQLWFAKDEEGNIVTINEVDKDTRNQRKYYCPICGTEVKSRLGEVNAWCFAHEKGNCSSESMFHFWYKNKLIEKGDKFRIESDIEREYICKEILVEQSYIINEKQYKPDLTIITETDEIIYFEMEYNNKKKLEDYLDIWNGLKNIVVEVDTKTLINSKSGATPVFKALWYEGKCFNVKNGEDILYYETIGKLKEQNYNKVIDEKVRVEIEKLDWLWKDIQKYKMGEVGIEEVSNLVRSIEEIDIRKIVVKILRKGSCNQIIKDYVKFHYNKIESKLDLIKSEINNDIEYKIIIPHLVYDRIYTEIITIISYKKECFYNGYDINNINNINNEDLSEKIRKVDVYLKEYSIRKKVFDSFKNYEVKVDYFENTQNIQFKYNPYLSYYYSKSLDEHRLYLNDFKPSRYGEFLRIIDCISKKHVKEYLNTKVKEGNIFNNEEIVLIDKIGSELKLKHNEKIKFEIHNGNKLYIYLNYNCGTYNIFNIAKSKDSLIDIPYKTIENAIELKILELKLEEEQYNTISEYIEMLNVKYETKEWNFEYQEYKNRICFQRKSYQIDIFPTPICEYLDSVITKEEFKIKMNKFFFGFEEKEDKKVLAEEKINDIEEYIFYLNKKYWTIGNGWTCRKSNISQNIILSNSRHKSTQLGKIQIEEYMSNKINLEDFKERLFKEMSEYIRNSIYNIQNKGV